MWLPKQVEKMGQNPITMSGHHVRSPGQVTRSGHHMLVFKIYLDSGSKAFSGIALLPLQSSTHNMQVQKSNECIGLEVCCSTCDSQTDFKSEIKSSMFYNLCRNEVRNIYLALNYIVKHTCMRLSAIIMSHNPSNPLLPLMIFNTFTHSTDG